MTVLPSLNKQWNIIIAYTAALIGAVLNVAFGTLNHAAGLPLYFDSIFTIVVAALIGFGPGLVTAAATNGVLALVGAVPFPFVLCNASTAIIVWVVKRYGGLASLTRYLWVGFWSGLSNAVLGSIISAFIFGGVTTVHHIDDLVSGFVIAGQSLVSSVFVAGALTNFVDKELSAVAAFGLALLANHGLDRLRNQPTSPSSRA